MLLVIDEANDRQLRRFADENDRNVFRVVFAPISCFAQAPAGSGKPTEPTTKTTYLVIYRPGPAWLTGKSVMEQPLKGRGKYMLSLYTKGSMRLAGPLTDDAGGAVVLEVFDETEAKAIVVNDPAVKSGIFVYEMHPWKLQPWDELAKKVRNSSQQARPTEGK